MNELHPSIKGMFSAVLQVLSYGLSLSEQCDSFYLVPGAEPPTVQPAYQYNQLGPTTVLPDPFDNGGWNKIVNNKAQIFTDDQ